LLAQEGNYGQINFVEYLLPYSSDSRLLCGNIVVKAMNLAVPLRHAGAKGEREYIFYSFLTSALDGAALYPQVKDPRPVPIG
jgi:hypothetical protein